MDYHLLPKCVRKYAVVGGCALEKLETIHAQVIGSLNNKCTSDEFNRDTITLTCTCDSDTIVVRVHCVGTRVGKPPTYPMEYFEDASEPPAETEFDRMNAEELSIAHYNDDTETIAYYTQRPLNRNQSILDDYTRSLDEYYDTPLQFDQYSYYIESKSSNIDITEKQFMEILDTYKVTTDYIDQQPQSVIVDVDAIDFNALIAAIHEHITARDVDRTITSINNKPVFVTMDSLKCRNSVKAFKRNEYPCEYIDVCNELFKLYLRKLNTITS